MVSGLFRGLLGRLEWVCSNRFHRCLILVPWFVEGCWSSLV